MKHLQRAAGGGIAVMGKSENGPVRASRNIRSRYDVTARYSRMIESIRKNEVRWHRKSIFTPVLSIDRIGVFLC